MTNHASTVTRGVHHIGLSVPNLEQTRSFFTNCLNFEVVGEQPSYPAVFISDGVVVLTLWQLEDPTIAVGFDRKRNIGLHHLALGVADAQTLTALHRRLESEANVGLEFGPEPLVGTELLHMICTTPGGIRLEFVAPR